MRTHRPVAYRPQLEMCEARNLLSGGAGLLPGAGLAHHPAAAQLRHHGLAVQGSGSHHPAHRPHHSVGGAHAILPPFFSCIAKGIYNFAMITITNNATTAVNFRIQATPCPGQGVWFNETFASGESEVFYTHFPSWITPSFKVDLGGLNLFSPTPNVVPNEPWPYFVPAITKQMGAQYQIVQPSAGVFLLKPGS